MPIDFQGSKVASFESRRAEEMAHLVSHHRGIPLSAPTMREIPLEKSTEAMAFIDRLLAGDVEILILMTGVGTRMLARVAELKHPLERFTGSLRKITTVARGPKPIAALRELGLDPDLTVPEPNTWRDVAETLEGSKLVSGKRIAIQEYGIPNPHLADALTRGGATVTRVPVYRWDLPEDLRPLQKAIQEILAGRVDYALFTNAMQVRHLFQVAAREGRDGELQNRFRSICIGSIGPITTEAISESGLRADFETDSPHMGNLVRGLARRGPDLLKKKRTGHSAGVDTNRWRRIDAVWPPAAEPEARKEPEEPIFLRACRRQKTPFTPIWLMRQAGRYQREYRQMRARVSFLELCKTPDLAAEVTLMAVDQLGVDAAILFADILLVLEPMRVGLRFAKGDGPIIDRPVRTRRDVESIGAVDAAELEYVYEAVKRTRRALRPDLALIGFCGAPFTVASYLVEGSRSRHYETSKKMMYNEPGTWQALMELLVRVLADYLNRQIEAGADAVQVFDSWVGCLSPDDYRRFVLPYTKALIASIRKPVPVIHFATGNPALLGLLKEAGGDVIALDWRLDLGEAWKLLGDEVAVMGNLDPTVLLSSPNEIRRRAAEIIGKAAGRPGHIFNLGHGVLPFTPPDHVVGLIEAVHEMTAS
ncbi:MAG: uroporphyrinogen decarboxylase [Acidobacteriota bacterium]